MLWLVEIGLILWLGILTYLVWKNNYFLKKLFPNTGNFKDKIEEIVNEIRDLEEFRKQSEKYLQRISLKRYNPYHDTGGDQSFSVSLLDGKNNGLVITSLHSRLGTRIFAKPVIDGKEGDFKFSDEEKEVITKVNL